MSRGNTEVTDRFLQFYRNYCSEDILELAQEYPNGSRSLYVDYDDLFMFDRDIAEDYLTLPAQMQEYAEEALRLYDLPADVVLGQAHVRLHNLPPEKELDITDIRVSDGLVGSLVRTDVYVREASDVEAKVTEAAFECQRCGTMSYIPQAGDNFTEPEECQGCEREGPFKVKTDQSEFVDSQTVSVCPLPEAENASNAGLTACLKDDIAGLVAEGDRVRLVGQLVGETDDSGTLDLHIDAVSVRRLEEPLEEFWDGDYLADGLAQSVDVDTVQEFASRTRAVLETQDMNELETRSKIITPFISLLGWRVYHPEVQLEYTSDSLGDQDRADYVLLNGDSNPTVVVEAKQEGRVLKPHESQLKRYMRNFGAEFGLLTNGGSFRFFISDVKSDSPDEINILTCDLKSLYGSLDVLNAFSRESQVDTDTTQRLEELAEEAGDGVSEQAEFSAVQEDRRKAMREVIGELEESNQAGAPIDEAIEKWANRGHPREDGKSMIKNLRIAGDVYEPVEGHLRTI